MNFTMSERQVFWRDRAVAFMDEHIAPAAAVCEAQLAAFGSQRWQVAPVLEEHKAKAGPAGQIRSLRLADGPDEVHNRRIARIECGKYKAAKAA